jgi:hypothetical protein
MVDIELIVKVRITKDSIIFEKRYLPPEVEEALEKADGITTKLVLKKPHSRGVRSYEQLKLWFSLIGDILTHYGEEINKENKEAMSEYLKEIYIPTEYMTVGGKEIPIPKHINDAAGFSKDKFRDILNKIMEDYRKEGVMFRKDLEEKFEVK